MSKEYLLNLPLNGLSFGQVSVALLREARKAGHEPSVVPIGGQIDLSSQPEDKEFNMWLQSCIAKALKTHKRDIPAIKLWHLNNGLESLSNKQVLLTFHETDIATAEEINVVKNNHKVIFTNKYSKNIFSEYGCENIESVPLGFDSFNFNVTNKEYFKDGRITFNLVGKLEKRKNHQKIIQSWLKKFGNNPKYFLNCALWNHFIPPEKQKEIYIQILEGKRYSNIQFLGFMQQNALYNDFLNSGDIIVGMSGGEGFDLGVFTSLALGKHGVILNAHAYKEYANQDNSVMVSPSGKEPCFDGVFFHPNQPFNQGNFYSWEPDEFVSACERAIKRVECNRVNLKGLELQEKFTYKNTFDNIIKEI